jgi:ubiquinone/menaquinone biosynthesis C-methylase UbiE
MADGRDIPVWDNHAEQCREAKRELFTFEAKANSVGGWLRDKVVDNLTEGSKCVDVGCGPGYWRNLFEGNHYTGVDQSTGMIALAKDIEGSKLKSIDWVLGNGRNLPLEEEHFDMAFTASVLQHNRHDPDKTEIVKSIYSILKSGGFLLCTENTFREDNCPQLKSNSDYTDGYTFTPEGWKTFMAGLGFKFLEFNGKSEYLFQKE